MKPNKENKSKDIKKEVAMKMKARKQSHAMHGKSGISGKHYRHDM